MQNVIDNISKLLDINYIQPEHMRLIDRQLARIKITDPVELAVYLTDTLYAITHDSHLFVQYAPELAEQFKQQQNAETSPALPPISGFRCVQRLAGNVGYIALDSFQGTDQDAATAAMQLLAGCSALIFDLRNNSGGEVSMVQWLASYLFEEAQFLHTYEPYEHQIWTHDFVPGIRYPDTPVYILVSQNTYSAAEEFAYDLQAMKRAIIVGEQTGGGAHLTEIHVAGSGFIISIPVARVVNPITGTNWQGIGVQPDIATQDALKAAHLHAVQDVWDLEWINALYNPVLSAQQSTFTGTYGARHITLEDERLHLQYQHSKHELIPLTDTRFALGNSMRVEFEADTMTLIQRNNKRLRLSRGS